MADYQGLYEESKHHIRELQKKVASLQEEIRERCQSYLLQNSGHKKKIQSKSTIKTMQFKHLYTILIQPQIKEQIIKNQPIKLNQKLSNSKTSIPNSLSSQLVLQTPKKQQISQLKQVTKQQNPPLFDDQILKALKQRLSETQAAKNQIFKDMNKLQEKYKIQQKQLSKAKPIFEQNEKLKKKIDVLSKKNNELMEMMSIIQEQLQELPQNNIETSGILTPAAKAKHCLDYLKKKDYLQLENSEARTYKIVPDSVQSIFKEPQQSNKTQIQNFVQQINKLKADLEAKEELERQYLRLAEQLTYLKTKKNQNQNNHIISNQTQQAICQQNPIIQQINRKVQALQSENLKLKSDWIESQQKESKTQQKIIMLEKQNASLREQIQVCTKKLQQLPTRRRSSTDNNQEIARLKASNKDLQEQIQLLKVQKKTLNAFQSSKNEDLLPIYVQEDMDIQTNEYVQRKFVRKKLIRRNLSAMTFRSVSKSKKEVIETLQSKLKTLKQAVKSNPDEQLRIKKYVHKIDRLKKQMERSSNRISQASKEQSQNPSSNLSESSDGQVYFFEIQTDTPNKSTYAGKIVDSRKNYDQQRKNRFDFAKKGKTQSSGVL